MAVTFDRLWSLDVEGNGASPPEIVELAMVELVDLALSERQKHWLVRPQKPIDPRVSNLHGLTDKEVAAAPSIDDIADDLLLWLEGAALVGHNVSVEVEVLGRALPDWSPAAAIDTLKLARGLRPGLPSYSLENLGRAFDLFDSAAKRTGGRPHSALFDATLTGLLLAELLSPFDNARRLELLRDADILASRTGQLL